MCDDAGVRAPVPPLDRPAAQGWREYRGVPDRDRPCRSRPSGARRALLVRGAGAGPSAWRFPLAPRGKSARRPRPPAGSERRFTRSIDEIARNFTLRSLKFVLPSGCILCILLAVATVAIHPVLARTHAALERG